MLRFRVGWARTALRWYVFFAHTIWRLNAVARVPKPHAVVCVLMLLVLVVVSCVRGLCLSGGGGRAATNEFGESLICRNVCIGARDEFAYRPQFPS
jgi:hypothetical protein